MSRDTPDAMNARIKLARDKIKVKAAEYSDRSFGILDESVEARAAFAELENAAIELTWALMAKLSR